MSAEEHEYKPIQWVEADSTDTADLRFRDKSDSLVYLFEVVGEPLPQVLIISFMAEWCKNCRYEAPHLEEIYKQYYPLGLGVIVIMEYSDPEKSEAFVKKYKFSMPVVTGDLTAKDDSLRRGTQHHRLRSAVNDPRAWGTPFHVIIENGNFRRLGFVLGEFRRDELKAYLDHILNR